MKALPMILQLKKEKQGIVSKELNARLCPDSQRLKIRLPWLESVIILCYFGW